MSSTQQTPAESDAAGPGSDLSRLLSRWWLVALLGVLSIAAGIIVLAWPGITLVTLAWVSGIFLLVDGVLELAAVLRHRTESRGMLALLGALSIIAGLSWSATRSAVWWPSRSCSASGSS